MILPLVVNSRALSFEAVLCVTIGDGELDQSVFYNDYLQLHCKACCWTGIHLLAPGQPSGGLMQNNIWVRQGWGARVDFYFESKANLFSRNSVTQISTVNGS